MQSLTDIFDATDEQIAQCKFNNILVVVKALKKPKDILLLCRHPCMSMDVYFANKNIPWNMSALSANLAIEPINVVLFPSLDWDYHHMSRHPKLDFHVLNLCHNKPWDYQYIASRSNVTVPMIMSLLPTRVFLGIDRPTKLFIRDKKLPGFGTPAIESDCSCSNVDKVISDSTYEYDDDLYLDDPDYMDDDELDMIQAIIETI